MLNRIAKAINNHRQLLLYIFFGGCTTVVCVGSFALFDSVLHIHELLANVYAWVLAVGFAYGTNRKWVFRSQTRGKAVWKEVSAFFAGRLLTLAMEEVLLLVFVTWLDFPGTAIKLVGQIAVLLGNFWISKCIVFQKKK